MDSNKILHSQRVIQLLYNDIQSQKEKLEKGSSPKGEDISNKIIENHMKTIFRLISEIELSCTEIESFLVSSDMLKEIGFVDDKKAYETFEQVNILKDVSFLYHDYFNRRISIGDKGEDYSFVKGHIKRQFENSEFLLIDLFNVVFEKLKQTEGFFERIESNDQVKIVKSDAELKKLDIGESFVFVDENTKQELEIVDDPDELCDGCFFRDYITKDHKEICYKISCSPSDTKHKKSIKFIKK